MLISTEIGSFRKKLGDDRKVISLLKNAGFTAYDFSMSGEYGTNLLKDDDCIEYAKSFKSFADDLNIVCNQTHAPFPTAKINDDEYNKRILPLLERSIKVSGILGAKICVVHPCNDYSPEQNLSFYKQLLPVAKEYNVKIATENMWNYDFENKVIIPAANSDHVRFKKTMDLLHQLDKDVFVACVDIGHAEIKNLNTSAVQMIKTLGEHVQCIHLHDVDFIHDLHFLPFTSAIDYLPVIKALKDINYTGDVTLESSYFLGKGLPVELLPSFAKLFADVANWFKNQIEK